MENQTNPWVARFDDLLDTAEIKRRATIKVPPLIGLNALDEVNACNRLETALRTIFAPTTQCLNILLNWIRLARAHCAEQYPDVRQFLGGVYSEKAPLHEMFFPICLTGLGGVGKSELIKAFLRILPDAFNAVVDAEHSEFPFQSAWSIAVKTHGSFTEVLKTVAGVDEKTADLIGACRNRAFRNGVPFLAADEFQFATQSVSANALVTKMLLSLAYIGIPFAFAANFSLLHRLQRRPQEDQDRLLSNVVVLLPEHEASQDWHDIVSAQKAVAPDIFVFDEAGANALNRYSSGVKRAAAKLLKIAYRISRHTGGKVTTSEIELAYKDGEFSGYRKHIEVITQQYIQNKPQKGRKDLWCPFEIPKSAQAKIQEQMSLQRRKQVAAEKLRSSLNEKEAKALKAITKQTKAGKKTGTVLSMQKKSPATADELLADTNWMLEKVWNAKAS